MRAQIISGFPGVGKTHMAKQLGNTILKISDSDSSGFSWCAPGVRDPNFPCNYIKHIASIMNLYDLIFVSSHKVVRDALIDNNIPFLLVYPDKKLKSEYLHRYNNRGSDIEFVKMMDKNWDKFITEIEEINDELVTKIKLSKDESIGRVIHDFI